MVSKELRATLKTAVLKPIRRSQTNAVQIRYKFPTPRSYGGGLGWGQGIAKSLKTTVLKPIRRRQTNAVKIQITIATTEIRTGRVG